MVFGTATWRNGWKRLHGHWPEADPRLKTAVVIELVAAAQCDDGYLNTYFTAKAPQERWVTAECHGNFIAPDILIEAGVAFFQAASGVGCWSVVCRFGRSYQTALSATAKISCTAIRATRK